MKFIKIHIFNVLKPFIHFLVSVARQFLGFFLNFFIETKKKKEIGAFRTIAAETLSSFFLIFLFFSIFFRSSALFSLRGGWWADAIERDFSPVLFCFCFFVFFLLCLQRRTVSFSRPVGARVIDDKMATEIRPE